MYSYIFLYVPIYSYTVSSQLALQRSQADFGAPSKPRTLVVLPAAEGAQGHPAQPAEAKAVGAGGGIGKRRN